METKSLLRKEEYRMLSVLSIDGPILDIGGSKKSGYHELIQGTHTITVGNIDESYGTDVIFDAQKKWPFEEAVYSGVLLINVLEHIYDYRTVLNESFRVLKKGGRTISITPFLFPVHGCPSDYFRYSKFALEKMFAEAGFESVTIKELGTGVHSVVYHLFIGFVKWQWLAKFFIFIAKRMDALFSFIRPQNKMSAEYMPLAYYVEAKK
jgi:hypothetical protein